jgi:hypothetical protein
MHQSALLSYRCLDQKRRNDNTAARRFKRNRIQLPMCSALLGSCELPSASARLPTFFKMLSSCCSSSEESSEKTLPKSAACFRKTGTMSFLPLGVSATIRMRRSSPLSTRLTSPLPYRRSTATLIDPGVRFTFGPIVFTGREPLCSSTSRTRKSESPNIYGINKTTSRFVLHLSSSKDNESKRTHPFDSNEERRNHEHCRKNQKLFSKSWRNQSTRNAEASRPTCIYVDW